MERSRLVMMNILLSHLLLPLITAAIFPLIHERPRVVAWLATLITAATAGLAAVLLIHVSANGSFRVVFSSTTAAIGIELVISSFSALFALIITSITTLILLFSIENIQRDVEEDRIARYYTIMMVLIFAMLVLIYTNDLFNAYVFMAIVAITATALVSIKQKKENFMASFRYLILSEIGSLVYLLGVAILYLLTGALNMDLVHQLLLPLAQTQEIAILAATAFVMIGLSIKAAIFPLHIWLPDAHSSAPSSSSAMLSAIVIKAYLIVMIKFLYVVLGPELVTQLSLDRYLLFVGVIAMIMGSFFALGQRDVKRILAYSTVAQVGYIVIGLGLMTPLGLFAAMFHMTSHAIMKSALFLSSGVFIHYKKHRRVRQFQGLGYLAPLSMVVFGIASLGMIGIPLTSGFVGKFQLSLATVAVGESWIVVFVLLSSFLNAMYYLPLLLRAYIGESSHHEHLGSIQIEAVPKTMLVPVSLLGLSIVLLGVFPATFFDLLDLAVAVLMGGA
jgi:multicomponent Na+:H+ antiporter subunit D